MAHQKESDGRFSKVFSDPKFRTLRKIDKTLKIDNRFKSMFTEDKFKLKYSMDKRGKSKKHLISEDYKKFYRLSDESENDEANVDKDDDFSNDDLKVENKNNLLNPNLTHKYGYHRGMLQDSDKEASSSSSSSESEESEDEEQELEHEWGELDKDATQIEEATSRIAICNADWDRINAQDLYVLLNSFKRSTGAIDFVRLYYSKFGEERLKVEERKGPSEFIFGKAKTIEDFTRPENVSSDEGNESSDEDGENEEQSENDSESYGGSDVEEEGDIKDTKAVEKLRKYQLERLKYFYAVASFDSAETASEIYNELDGMEYESSSTTLDIRFIPDETTFDDVKLKEECTSMPNSTNYNAPAFINSALQQSNVKLTWDETDPKRKNVFDKAFDKDNEDDLKAYLASSDEDNFDQEVEIAADLKEDEKIAKYKNLLSSLDDKKDEDYEMEVTWDPTLKSTTEGLINKKDSKSTNGKREAKSKVETNMQLVDENDSDVEEKNDLISDSEDEAKTKSKNKDRFKKWKKKRLPKESNEQLDSSREDSSKLELLMVDIEKNGPSKRHFNYKEIVDSYSKMDNKSKTKGTPVQAEKKESFKVCI